MKAIRALAGEIPVVLGWKTVFHSSAEEALSRQPSPDAYGHPLTQAFSFGAPMRTPHPATCDRKYTVMFGEKYSPRTISQLKCEWYERVGDYLADPKAEPIKNQGDIGAKNHSMPSFRLLCLREEKPFSRDEYSQVLTETQCISDQRFPQARRLT